MFSSGPNYTKLKTNLRLAITRLKLLEKKKSELTEKSRREIADYISAGKYERAKIRVEFIIREDYFVEALEIVEMYCDLLLARFGLIQNMKELDEGIAEAVSSIIWVAPRLQSDVQEIKVIADLLAAKYGPQYAEACRIESVDTISPKLKHKLSIQSPPKLLVEKYVIEIASVFNINYEPDPQVMALEQGNDAFLIDLSSEHKNNLGGGGGGNGGFPQPLGFVGYPQPPGIPSLLDPPAFSYPMNPGPGSEKGGGPSAPMPFNYNIPPQNHPEETKQSNTDFMDNLPTYSMVYPDVNKNTDDKPKPLPRTKMNNDYNLPDLPSVPNVAPGGSNDADDSTVDFDDLTRRFNELKKRM
ncbi:IST1 homolog isoform X2 [Anthonomus grandis grandis]|uniref:IST1 homolog isoform X2 n=1 Tax=Anthonomus grandis grandis TaxID=2921223 RepID=UPI002165CA18|nr:IST1 homolog isoform X2 [Anthonomus grandis grandis]